MAHAGQVMINPVTGLRTTFLETAADTDGELLSIEWAAGPDWAAGPKHVHPLQEERFTVRSGHLRSHVAGVEREHGPGDVIVVPPGAVHTIWSVGEDDVRLQVDFRPALRSEDVLEALAALARTGRVNSEGVPRNPLDLALIIRDYEDEIYLASPPLAVQRALFGPLAWMGHRLGRAAGHRYPAATAAAEPA